MPLKFMCIPAVGCTDSEAELNNFTGSHRILAVDRRFVEAGQNSCWAICIDYLEGSVSVRNTSRSSRNRIDYRELLTETQFTVFASLRELRKKLAAKDAVPVYTVFTNEQLSQIAQLEVADRANLKTVEGVGDGKLEKYGDAILKLINKGAADATCGESVSPDTGI